MQQETGARIPGTAQHPARNAMDMRSAQVVDVEVVSEGPTDSATGPVTWATVEIYYAAAELMPEIKIRVPVPGGIELDPQQVRTAALVAARALIQHACELSVPDSTASRSDRFSPGN